MKAKIFSFVDLSHDTMVASARIARFVSETLQIPTCWDESVADDPGLDVLIVVGGAYAFAGSSVLAALGATIAGSTRVVWIQNDYTVIPPKDQSGAESLFRAAFRLRASADKAPTDFWTTCENYTRAGTRLTDRTGTGWRLGPGSVYVNWNALTLDLDRPVKPHADRLSPESLLYYGSFRNSGGKKSRVRYFDRYFASPYVHTVISSPSRKFQERYADPRIRHTSKIPHPITEYLEEFGMGLYVEDEQSHYEYHSPANRLYEMLSSGLPIVFQPECRRTLEKAGFTLQDNWIASTNIDIASLMSRAEQIGAEQRALLLPTAITQHDALVPMLQQHWEQYV